MKFQSKKTPSAAEHRLAEAQAAKAAAEAEMTAAQAVLSRLEAAARATAPLNAELALIDRDDAAAMSQWAANPDGKDAPVPDGERRAELLKRLATAEAQARSAAGAMAAPRAALNAAGQRAAAAQRAAWIAAKLVALEEAEATLEPLKAAIRGVYEAKRRVDAVREGVLANLAPAEDTREIFIALSAFDHRRLAAELKPLAEVLPPEGAAPDAQHTLATALARSDPLARRGTQALRRKTTRDGSTPRAWAARYDRIRNHHREPLPRRTGRGGERARRRNLPRRLESGRRRNKR